MSDVRLQALERETNARLEKLKAVAAANAASSSEQHELSASSQLAVARQQELKNTIEIRKRARELHVKGRQRRLRQDRQQVDRGALEVAPGLVAHSPCAAAPADERAWAA